MGKKICGIYCIENLVNGKKYIGQTVDVKSRLDKHKNLLSRQKHPNDHLQHAWDLYGADNFMFYVLEECAQEDLDNKEIAYIRNFNVDNSEFGYNIESGGRSTPHVAVKTKIKISKSLKGRKVSQDTIDKIVKFHTGRKRSDDTRRRMSENHCDFSGEKHPQFGTHLSDKTKQKISKKALERLSNKENHPNFGNTLPEQTVEKIKTTLTGKYIGELSFNKRPVYCPELDEHFWSASEAYRKYGVSQTGISACLHGRQDTAGIHPITGEKLHWQDDVTLIPTIQN